MTKQEEINNLKGVIEQKDKRITDLEQFAFYEGEHQYNEKTPNNEKTPIIYYKDEVKGVEKTLARVDGERNQLEKEIGNLNKIIKYLINPELLKDEIKVDVEIPLMSKHDLKSFQMR